MLPISRLLEYQAEVVELLRDQANNKLFNYSDMVIDDSELSKILKERTAEENTFFISVIPQFNMKGVEDNAKWQNSLMFFILDKTDYSEHDRDGFRQIFVETQVKARAFIDKLLEDKANHESMFCGFLTWLDENSITVSPVWKKDGCNGWMVEISFDTLL